MKNAGRKEKRKGGWVQREQSSQWDGKKGKKNFSGAQEKRPAKIPTIKVPCRVDVNEAVYGKCGKKRNRNVLSIIEERSPGGTATAKIVLELK